MERRGVAGCGGVRQGKAGGLYETLLFSKNEM